MSRVMLFVQEGTAKPKVLSSFHPGNARHFKPEKAFIARAPDADRWWLVECADAEAGRRIIAGEIAVMAVGPSGPDAGRILASGGKAVSHG